MCSTGLSLQREKRQQPVISSFPLFIRLTRSSHLACLRRAVTLTCHPALTPHLRPSAPRPSEGPMCRARAIKAAVVVNNVRGAGKESSDSSLQLASFIFSACKRKHYIAPPFSSVFLNRIFWIIAAISVMRNYVLRAFLAASLSQVI